MELATVTAHRQITLPKEFLSKIQANPGDKLLLDIQSDVSGDYIALRKKWEFDFVISYKAKRREGVNDKSFGKVRITELDQVVVGLVTDIISNYNPAQSIKPQITLYLGARRFEVINDMKSNLLSNDAFTHDPQKEEKHIKDFRETLNRIVGIDITAMYDLEIDTSTGLRGVSF